ncbi:MAG: hypothetical protein WCO96_09120 [Actinomycetes bacterium]
MSVSPTWAVGLVVCAIAGVAAPSAQAAPVMPQVSAGIFHTCGAKASDSSVVCWGNNEFTQAAVPSDLGPVTQVSAAYSHTCAVRSTDGTAVCWGDKADYDSGQVTVPVDLGPVAQVTTSNNHTCAVKATDRTVVCWGGGRGYDYGQVSPPADLGPVTQVSAGPDHTCAVRATDSLVVCWGDDGSGQTTMPSDLGPVTQVSAGDLHTCAVRSTDGTAVCWGGDSSGQATVPSDLGPVTQVSAGVSHTCAIKASDNTVRCWGDDYYGQTTVPTDLGRVNQVSSGRSNTCAVKLNATIRCWGGGRDGDYGQLTVPTTDFPSFSDAVVNFGDTSGLDFGDVTAGRRSAVLTIPVASKSLALGVPLTVKSLAFTKAFNSFDAFSASAQTCTAGPLANGDYCAIRVRFAAEIWQRGELRAELTVTDDSAVGTHVIPLTARAIAPPSFLLTRFQWVPRSPGAAGGNFYWAPSEAAKVTITLTQPVSTTVSVRKGRKVIKKTVRTIKPVTLVANKPAGIPVSDGVMLTLPSFTWNGKVGTKAAAKGTWKATITAVSPSGRASLTQSVTIR